MPMLPLPASFYNRAAQETAQALLGMRLVRLMNGQRAAGYIIEAEAYDGESDLACHARSGRTPRTEIMYGPPGRAYVYFIYGMHWMFNCVTNPEGFPAAVLIRAMVPSEGLDWIAAQRVGRPQQEWANGPARLCQAMNINGQQNGVDLTSTSGGLWIEPGLAIPDGALVTGTRVGIQNVPEPWRSKPWRYRIDMRVLEQAGQHLSYPPGEEARDHLCD